MIDNIDIKHPFTLDLRKDGSSPTRKPNEMQILKNYITKPGAIRARDGITLFTHTPFTTPPDFPETGVWNSAICAAVLKFEDASNMGYNTVSSANLFVNMSCPNYSGQTTRASAQYKQGSYSMLIDRKHTAINSGAGNPARGYGVENTKASMPDWFPGKSTTCTTMLITCWVYPTTTSLSLNEEDIVRFGNNTASILFRWFDLHLQAYFWDGSGGNFNNQISTIMAEQQWQYVACWCDYAQGTHGIYHYNDVTKVATWTSGSTVSSRYFRLNSQRDAVGGGVSWDAGGGGYVLDASEEPHAYLDYLTMWTGIYAVAVTTNITLIEAIRDLHAS